MIILKNTLILVLLVFTVSFYCGQIIITHSIHNKDVVDTNSCVQSLISSDFSLEEDPVFVQQTPKLLPAFNVKDDVSSSVTDFFSLKLYSSIWQPPKIS